MNTRRTYPKIKVATVKAQLPKTIGSELKPKIVLDVDDDICTIEIDFKGTHWGYDFGIEELSNCCGVLEIGGLNVSSKSNVVDDSVKIKAIKDTLLEVFSVNKMKTFIITTIPNDNACNIMAEALKDRKLFTPVKTFRNGSMKGNEVTVWISNN